MSAGTVKLVPNLRRVGFSLPDSSRKRNDRDEVGRLKPTLQLKRRSLAWTGFEQRNQTVNMETAVLYIFQSFRKNHEYL